MEKKFQTGEVVRARVRKNPLIFHYGLIVNMDFPYILHNPMGGNPTIDTVDEFFKERYLEKSFGVLTKKPAEVLLNDFELIKHKNFSLVKFNCEDFINYLIEDPYFLLGKFHVFIGFLILILLIIAIFMIGRAANR